MNRPTLAGVSDLAPTLTNLLFGLNTFIDFREIIEANSLVALARKLSDTEEPMALCLSGPAVYDVDACARKVSDHVCDALFRVRTAEVALAIWSSLQYCLEFRTANVLGAIARVVERLEDNPGLGSPPLACELLLRWRPAECLRSTQLYSRVRTLFLYSAAPYSHRLLQRVKPHPRGTAITYCPDMSADALTCLLAMSRNTEAEFMAAHYEGLSRALCCIMDLRRTSSSLKLAKMEATRCRANRNLRLIMDFYAQRRLLGPRLGKLWHWPLPSRASRLIVSFVWGEDS
jgi:hypothetical protein